jgi:hypothetical protein
MQKEHYWWSAIQAEKYWCEITDREKPGEDLLCPQTQDSGKPFWSYSLILQIRPGDIVFHYYTPKKAFVGASVAAGVALPDQMLWTAHGTVSRRKVISPKLRPAWRLPIRDFVTAEKPVTLAEAQKDQDWVRRWMAEKKAMAEVVASPFQAYPNKLRACQGYLTKMPLAFINRWIKLKQLVEQLSGSSYVEQLASELNGEEAVLAAVVDDVTQNRRQGFHVSPKARRAIEEYAVQRAIHHYETRGYAVEVHGKPYDLRCSNGDSVIHVEVKGTTTTGEEVLLTPNEVTFADQHPTSMALFIVSGIQVSEDDPPTASAGAEIEIQPWTIERKHITPICYSYVVPQTGIGAGPNSAGEIADVSSISATDNDSQEYSRP